MNLLELTKTEDNNSASLYLNNSSEAISSSFEVYSEEILIKTNSETYSVKIKEANYSLTGEGNIYLVLKNDDISLVVKFEEIYEKIMKNTASVSVSMVIMELKDKVLLQENIKNTSDLSVIGVAIIYYGSYAISTVIYAFIALIPLYLIVTVIIKIFPFLKPLLKQFF